MHSTKALDRLEVSAWTWRSMFLPPVKWKMHQQVMILPRIICKKDVLQLVIFSFIEHNHTPRGKEKINIRNTQESNIRNKEVQCGSTGKIGGEACVVPNRRASITFQIPKVEVTSWVHSHRTRFRGTMTEKGENKLNKVTDDKWCLCSHHKIDSSLLTKHHNSKI